MHKKGRFRIRKAVLLAVFLIFLLPAAYFLKNQPIIKNLEILSVNSDLLRANLAFEKDASHRISLIDWTKLTLLAWMQKVSLETMPSLARHLKDKFDVELKLHLIERYDSAELLEVVENSKEIYALYLVGKEKVIIVFNKFTKRTSFGTRERFEHIKGASEEKFGVSYVDEENRREQEYLLEPLGLKVADDRGRIMYSDKFASLDFDVDFWIVPHGQTDGNVLEVLQGRRSDNDPRFILNDAGKRQAEEGARQLWDIFGSRIEKGEKIVFITSSLTRTKQTAQVFQDFVRNNGYDIIIKEEPHSDEMDLGEWDGLTREEIKAFLSKKDGEVSKCHKKRDAFARSYSGESFLMLLKRVRNFLADINRKHQGQTVVLFGSGSFTAASKILLKTKDVNPTPYIDWANLMPSLKERGKPINLKKATEKGADLRNKEAAKYFNQFLGRLGDAKFDREAITALEKKFNSLDVTDRYEFSSKLLEILYRTMPEEKAFPEKPGAPTFVSINGPIVIDVAILFRRDSQTEEGTIVVDNVFINSGGTGPVSARIFNSFGANTMLYGFGSGIEGTVFVDLIEMREGTGKVDLLEGPSRSKVYLYVQDIDNPNEPLRQIGLQTPRQPLTDLAGEKLILHLEERLPVAIKDNEFVLFTGQIFQNAPPLVIKKLIEVTKSKGYKILTDYRPDLDVGSMRAMLEASPTIAKMSLEEFATVAGIEPSDLLDGHGPDYKKIAEGAVKIAKENKIKVVPITLGEYGAIIVYLDKQAKYRAIYVKAPKVRVESPLCAGDSFIAGFLWKLCKGAGIEEATVYGVASGSATTERPGNEVEVDPFVIEKMIARMHAQWGESLVNKPTFDSALFPVDTGDALRDLSAAQRLIMTAP